MIIIRVKLGRQLTREESINLSVLVYIKLNLTQECLVE